MKCGYTDVVGTLSEGLICSAPGIYSNSKKVSDWDSPRNRDSF